MIKIRRNQPLLTPFPSSHHRPVVFNPSEALRMKEHEQASRRGKSRASQHAKVRDDRSTLLGETQTYIEKLRKSHDTGIAVC